jgi:CheY-like chemotaxis protein
VDTVAHDLPRLDGVTILLLDDNAEFRDALDSMLRLCGATTLRAGRLAEARTAIQEANPALIVSDLVLPDGMGTELVAWVRERPQTETATPPVVAVTAFPHAVPAITRRDFAAYFVKPVDLASVCWTAATILGRGSAPR